MSLKQLATSLKLRKERSNDDLEEAASSDRRPSCQGLDTVEKDGIFEGIRVRIYLWNQEEKVLFYKNYDLTAKQVCEDIGKRELIPPDCYQYFSLWIVGCDLELQLKPSQDLVEIVDKFPRYAQKYTHHPGPYEWKFYYKREALLSKIAERKIKDISSIKLLYSEALSNVLTSRYPTPSEEDALTLAGIQMQIIYGDYNPDVHKEEFLTNKKFKGFLPKHLLLRITPLTIKSKYGEWEQKIYEEYEKHSGKPEMIAQLLYLQYVRQWPFYGSTFFVSCIDAPPKGYFEYRNETLYIAINAEGIHVIHKEKSKLFYTFSYDEVHWDANKDTVQIEYGPEDNLSTLTLITPQASLIVSLVKRAIRNLDHQDDAIENLRTTQSQTMSSNFYSDE